MCRERIFLLKAMLYNLYLINFKIAEILSK